MFFSLIIQYHTIATADCVRGQEGLLRKFSDETYGGQKSKREKKNAQPINVITIITVVSRRRTLQLSFSNAFDEWKI